MTKIVYNACYGGFSISEAAMLRYAELKGWTVYTERAAGDFFTTYWKVPAHERTGILPDGAWKTATLEERQRSNERYAELTLSARDLPRDDPTLVQVVEELEDRAGGACAMLRIAEVPAGSRYRIDEYAGLESVRTPDDYVWTVAV